MDDSLAKSDRPSFPKSKHAPFKPTMQEYIEIYPLIPGGFLGFQHLKPNTQIFYFLSMSTHASRLRKINMVPDCSNPERRPPHNNPGL